MFMYGSVLLLYMLLLCSVLSISQRPHISKTVQYNVRSPKDRHSICHARKRHHKYGKTARDDRDAETTGGDLAKREFCPHKK